MRKQKDIHEEVAAIDAERDDEAADLSSYVEVRMMRPVTQFGMAYSETVCVDFEDGRFPAWFAPFRPWFRRLNLDPAYGFHVRFDAGGSYDAIPLTALVLNEPRYDTGMIERMRKAAEAAGWAISTYPKMVGFTAFREDSPDVR